MTQHTPWGSTPLLIESSHRSSHLSIFYLIFPWWVTVFHFITHFWFIIWFVMLFWKGTFWNFPLTHWWAIAYWSLKMLLSHLDSPHVYKEAVLPQRKGNLVQVSFSAQLFFSKILNSTILDYSIWFVINSHQGLDLSDYIIRVCSYYVISLRSA